MLRTLLRLVIKLTISAGIAVLSLIGLSGAVVAQRANDHVYTDPADVPSRDTVIVPGSRIFPSGEPSRTVQDRLRAAATLFDEGTVDHVLVSGDNREHNYNEPAAMRDWLVDEAGLSPTDVTPDYAGLDTWDTCLRAREQFGVTEAVVVTQELHARRTAALCRAAGVDAVVLAVEQPPRRFTTAIRINFRESLANVKAWRDMISSPPARHGGPPIGLPGSAGMPEGGHPPDWDWQANKPASQAQP